MLYSRFTEIQSNLSRKKHHRTNQSSNVEAVLAIVIIWKLQSNLEEKNNLNILEDDFLLRTDPFIFTSIAPVLFDRSNKTS